MTKKYSSLQAHQGLASRMMCVVNSNIMPYLETVAERLNDFVYHCDACAPPQLASVRTVDSSTACLARQGNAKMVLAALESVALSKTV